MKNATMVIGVTVQVVDCGRFWAQNANAENVQLLNNIHTRLQQYICDMVQQVCIERTLG